MFNVTVSNRWTEVRELCADLASIGRCTPFQQPRWLENWFASIGAETGVEPLLVLVHENGKLVLFMPFVRLKRGQMITIEPADLGVTDYNAPLLGSEFAPSAASMAMMWNAIKRALPPADLIHITKTPATIDGAVNPFCLLSCARASALNGNLLSVEGKWSDYHQGLERTFRKEIERSWRVFEKYPSARFGLIAEPDRAFQMLDSLERQQADRMNELGKEYRLDQPHYADHYRRLVSNGLADGSVRLSALVSGDEVVAALLGITRSTSFAMVRISTGGNTWKNCSPGRLVIYKTMEALHDEGLRHFDFTIGDYAYKRRMGAQPVPLFDLIEAASFKGWPVVVKKRLRARLRRSPALQAFRARLKRS